MIGDLRFAKKREILENIRKIGGGLLASRAISAGKATDFSMILKMDKNMIVSYIEFIHSNLSACQT